MTRSAGGTRPVGLVGDPGPAPSRMYLLVRLACRVVARSLFRVTVSGFDNLPRDRDGRRVGGWICCGVPHRTWIEPLLLIALLPAAPRLVMLGDGPTMFRSRWRRLLATRVGGVVPVWGGAGAGSFAAHVAGAREAIAAGSVFAMFPEVGPPQRPPRLRRLSPGLAYVALRVDAPVVPVVFGGTDELFLGRRIDVRVLPAIPPAGSGALPRAGTPEERREAQALIAELTRRLAPVVAEAHSAAEPRAGTRRRLRWLTGPYPRAT